ncbi:PAP2 superfamily protein [Jatrophihabitans endophyticus]|uniref:PAP2 superfamily protein n=1 Tax=Jatrophihabitans endophyticus TaxID=1206085 RepID=A0A1M5KW29_9ACTN|nr:phosphatase PAP2 family protein [Jatrophihabitans endophyticus]SHG56947.1 PAP2 superfamily protein [Jatrophihabitans endophyticus]
MVATQTWRAAPAPTRRRRFPGLLPRRLLRWRRPVWWQEIAIIAVGYWLYSLVRNAIPEQASIATRHARSIQHVQDALHLNFERSFNHVVATNEWLAQILNYYYATLHFIVTPAVMVWLFVRRSHVYRGVRTVLVTTTLVALAGFALYPLAPPRLMPEFAYVDTLVKFHTWGSLASPAVAQHSNQYAAMPSLHIGWALWAGIAIFACARHRWVKALGLAYPLATLVVIVGTANHFLLDAVGGALAVTLGFGVQYALSGRGAFTAPIDAPDFGEPDPPLPGAHGGVRGPSVD